MEERLTIKQVMVMTRDLLRGIGTVPLEESEHIGVPISNAIRNLDACIEAINEGEAQDNAKEEVDGNADDE